MARRSSQSVQKRRRELAKQRKKEEKKIRRETQSDSGTDQDTLIADYLGLNTPDVGPDVPDEEGEEDED